MNKVFKTAKIRKTRSKFKVSIRKYIPKSSWLYSFATDFKFCYVRYLNRCEGFFTKFVKLNKLTAKKSKLGTHAPSFNHNKIASSTHSRRFCVSRMKLSTSGDVELNPGPLQGVNTQTTLKKKKASESRKQTSKINEVSAKRNRNPYLREYMKKRRTDEGRMQKSNNRNSSVLSGIDDQTYTTKKNQKNNVTVR
ncbi:unnamed protein product [Pocillopora meandrina]|uniref:Uncharacterized protein n=1 Tax=Pocillopora meandrina TaxID=46732 RepID=A0AAU9XYF0_9CNID|nr:unnamed protein product [Pocillopora meandrina]